MLLKNVKAQAAGQTICLNKQRQRISLVFVHGVCWVWREFLDFPRFFAKFVPNLVIANSCSLDRSPHHMTATIQGERRLFCASFKAHETSHPHLLKLLFSEV